MNKLQLLIPLAILVCCGSNNNQEAHLHYERALQLYMQKDLAGAESHIIQSISYNKKRTDAHMLLAKIRFFRGDDDGFVDAAKNYLDLTDNNHEGLLLFARWHMKKQRVKDAEKILNRVLHENGKNIEALYLLSILQRRQGDEEDSIVTLNRAFHNYFYLSRIHRTLADLYHELGLDSRSSTHKKMAKNLEHFMEGNQ